MSQAIHPPGPRTRLPGGNLAAFRRDRLGFMLGAARTYGDVAYFTIAGEHVFLLSDPAAIQAVLEVDHRFFHKGRGLERAQRLLGNGLLTSEGAAHERHRRLMLPAFHRDRLARYGGIMVDHALAHQARWLDGETRDIALDMQHVTRSIVARALFDADVSAAADAIDRAIASALGAFASLGLLLPGWVVERGLWPPARRFNHARAVLDDTILGMIRARRDDGRDHGDLLSTLLFAVDEAGEGMTDAQVRDEVMTLFLAGHETTANALAWTWFLVSEHPEVEARLHAELDRVLVGRAPTADDLPALRYTRQVLTEAMRLYPPAWIIGRRVVADYAVAGYGVPRGATVLVSPWVTHHDPRFWPDPFRFDPDRWRSGAGADRPRYAYFPFGGGPRRCIGEAFAWMEGVLVLAAIAARWRVSLVPGHPVEPLPLITLRPRRGVRVKLSARSPRMPLGTRAARAVVVG